MRNIFLILRCQEHCAYVRFYQYYPHYLASTIITLRHLKEYRTCVLPHLWIKVRENTIPSQWEICLKYSEDLSCMKERDISFMNYAPIFRTHWNAGRLWYGINWVSLNFFDAKHNEFTLYVDQSRTHQSIFIFMLLRISLSINLLQIPPV